MHNLPQLSRADLRSDAIPIPQHMTDNIKTVYLKNVIEIWSIGLYTELIATPFQIVNG